MAGVYMCWCHVRRSCEYRRCRKDPSRTLREGHADEHWRLDLLKQMNKSNVHVGWGCFGHTLEHKWLTTYTSHLRFSSQARASGGPLRPLRAPAGGLLESVAAIITIHIIAIITINMIASITINRIAYAQSGSQQFLAQWVVPSVGWPSHLFVIGNGVICSKVRHLCTLRVRPYVRHCAPSGRRPWESGGWGGWTCFV